MMLVKNYIKESDLHGIGVYAGEFIPKGTLIWKYDKNIDRVYTEHDLELLEENQIHYIKFYSYSPDPGIYVFCGDNGRYFNHSDNPNTDGVDSPDDDYGATIANRDIQEGEELTCNYEDVDYDFDRKKTLNKFV